MDRRELLGQLGLIALGAGFGLVIREFIFDRDAERRFALYNIMRELRKDMTRKEVEEIINRHDAPFISKRIEADYISLTVSLGGINQLYLSMKFAEEKLVQARFGGEDHPDDVPKDAPSNIE